MIEFQEGKFDRIHLTFNEGCIVSTVDQIMISLWCSRVDDPVSIENNVFPVR